ncbi:mevalonate kinase [Motiliproteus sediminis]|uniref:mevalonate kinase n=1 Tax=Motiliproteus sediminis TaxID=1468178 RepID=UPI001AF00A13|nr:mevalonate kinase [Motiliproteus sediminis]
MAQEYEIRASAPATLMLMGEHAVLFGHRAIVCAVDQRIHIRLKPLASRLVQIESALGDYESSLDALHDDKRLQFVLHAVRQLRDRIPSGFNLSIRSDFSHQVGLGSSAAVTVAVVAALYYWLDTDLDRQQVFDSARETVLQVQGRGSGADIAAATFGGAVAYRAKPVEYHPLKAAPPLSLCYAGYKTPTPEVLRRVASARNLSPNLYDELYRLMGEVSERAIAAFEEQDWDQFGWLMNYYHGLLDSLGVNDRVMADMVARMREAEGVLGAKISGSGLGDCAVALGRLEGIDMPYTQIPVTITARGVEADYA